jgi:hypothetical protein
MLAGAHKFIGLRADVEQLMADLRQDAIRAERRKQPETGPLERGIALGYADALMLAAEKLEALLAKYPG